VLLVYFFLFLSLFGESNEEFDGIVYVTCPGVWESFRWTRSRGCVCALPLRISARWKYVFITALSVFWDFLILLFRFAWTLNGFSWNLDEIITSTNIRTDYILSEIGQGCRIWQKIQIDVKLMLPRSEWPHKFHRRQTNRRTEGHRYRVKTRLISGLFSHATLLLCPHP